MKTELAGIATAIALILLLGTVFSFLSFYNVVRTPFLANSLSPILLYFSTAFTAFASYFTIGYLVLLLYSDSKSDSKKEISQSVTPRARINAYPFSTKGIPSEHERVTLANGFFPSEMNEELMEKNTEVPFYRSILLNGDYILLSPVKTGLEDYPLAYPLLYYHSNEEQLVYFTKKSTRKSYLQGICKTHDLINYQEKFNQAQKIFRNIEGNARGTYYTLLDENLEEDGEVQIFFAKMEEEKTLYYTKKTKSKEIKTATHGAIQITHKE